MANLYIVNRQESKFISESPIMSITIFVNQVDLIIEELSRYYKKIYWDGSSEVSLNEYKSICSCSKIEKTVNNIPSVKPEDRIIIPLNSNRYIITDIYLFEK